MKVDMLIVGGGVAAVSAAAELRERGFGGSVLLVTRELDPPYRRPPVTKELLTGRCERDDVRLRPEGWWAEHDVQLRTRAGVMALDLDARVARLASKEEIAFDRALLATGAMVRRLPIEGAQLEGVHYLRVPGNAEALRRELDAARDVVVVGGSFIATEVAASLTTLGRRCTLVMQERLPLERPFGPTVGRYVEGLLGAHGIELLGAEDVVAFAGSERVEAVVTASGRRIPADLVVIGAGALPDAALAKRAGLKIGPTGGIRCDARLQAGVEGIYAAGDVCEYDSVLHGEPVRIEHEEHAIAQGVTVARNVLGEAVEHATVPYFWTDLADWATIEYVGVARAWEREHVVGDPAGGRFSVWQVQDERLVGAVVAGRPDDLEIARELVAERAPVSRLERMGAPTR